MESLPFNAIASSKNLTDVDMLKFLPGVIRSSATTKTRAVATSGGRRVWEFICSDPRSNTEFAEPWTGCRGSQRGEDLVQHKNAEFVDLVESFPTSIRSRSLASIQPRTVITSPLEFAKR